MSLVAIYFTAMYIFHTGMNGRAPNEPQPVRRWDAGGADGHVQLQQQQQRRRLPVERLDSDLQAAFDNIREQDQQLQQPEHNHVARDDLMLDERPGRATDVNVPTSCNASAVEQRRLGDDFLLLAGIYLLSAFWDERPNDFDNWHNGTLIRLMTVSAGAQTNLALVCDFGSRQTPISFYEMCENHHKHFGSFILSCRVPDDVVEVPCFVTVVATSVMGVSSVDVPVRTLRPHAVSHSFSVCVPPVFGDLPPDKLVEFFEVTAVLSFSNKCRVSLIFSSI